MHILRSIFRVLAVCGCWRPRSWSSPYKKFLYTVYTVIVLLLVYTSTFFQLMDIVVNVKTQDEFSDNFYTLLAMMVSCHKVYSLLAIRGRIVVFTRMFERESFLPKDKEEVDIRTKFDRKADLNTLLYTLLVETSVVMMSCNGLYESRKLPLRMWLPYNYSSPLPHCIAYVQQTLALTAGSLMHVACDGLLCGLLIHTYSQIEILEHRLRAIKRGENESVKSFATMINKEFKMIITVQFAVSTLVVCFNFYQLAKTKDFSSKIFTLMYTSCMLTQIFFYCWYGNEVKLKSLQLSDVIVGIDWTPFDNSSKRTLLMIMRRSTIPIEFTSIHIVTMNLDSFVNLLKTAYSAYTMLQQSRG